MQLESIHAGQAAATGESCAHELVMHNQNEAQAIITCEEKLKELTNEMTSSLVLKFLLTVSDAGDGAINPNNAVTIGPALSLKRESDQKPDKYLGCIQDKELSKLNFIPSTVIADALLAACHVNTTSEMTTDPNTGISVQSSIQHPIQLLLVASKRWLGNYAERQCVLK